MKRFLTLIAVLFLALAGYKTTISQTPSYDVWCGGINDSSAINAAIASSQTPTQSYTIRVHGICQLASGRPIISVLNAHLEGDGKNNTWILVPDFATAGIAYVPVNGVTPGQAVTITNTQNATMTLDKLSILYPAGPPSNTGACGIAMQAQAAGRLITQAVIRDVGVYGAPCGILLTDFGGLLDNVTVMGFADAGLIIRAVFGDSGGIMVSNSVFVNYNPVVAAGQTCGQSATSGTGMRIYAGGSLKIINTGLACLYRGIHFIWGAQSSQIFIGPDVNVDTAINSAIFFERDPTFTASGRPAELTAVRIHDSTFSSPVGVYVATDVVSWLFKLDIHNNAFAGSSSSLLYLDAVDQASITENSITCEYAPNTVPINLGPHAKNVVHGRNRLRGCTNQWVDQNPSGNNTYVGTRLPPACLANEC